MLISMPIITKTENMTLLQLTMHGDRRLMMFPVTQP